MGLEGGTRLGHYEITGAIGKGGMGEVYRARDTKLGREVAVKVLPAEFSQDADRLARLEREARMLAALNHPNIAAIHGLEESGAYRFLVLELVEGETLADRLKRGAVPVRESLEVAHQVAEALEAAHEKGVVHRDLKPANIKITPEGRVKVLDFGLAKAFVGDRADVSLSNSPTLSMAATEAGFVLGTAGYMAPEQASGEVVDQRADVWAFGVVLFEMLSGKGLFTGKTVTHVLASVMKEEPHWSTLPARLHPRIRFLLERCLEKEPADRCPAIGEARAEISKVLALPTGVLAPTTTPERTTAAKTLPWVAGLALAALSGLAGWSLKTELPRPVLRFTQTEPGRMLRATGRPVLAVAPDGSGFVYNSTEGFVWRSFGEFDTRILTGTEEIAANPFFSPDGQWVGFVSGSDSQLQKISINGGARQPITPVSAVFGASWGPDDIILFAESGGIMRVPAAGGEAQVVIETGPDEQAYGPQLLPGGEWVLFTLATEVSQERWDNAIVVAQSLTTDERRVLVERGSDARYVPTGHIVYALGTLLFAVPFDVHSIEVTGDFVPVGDGLLRATGPFVNTAAANYGFTDDGTFVQLYGDTIDTAVPETHLVFANTNGSTERIALRPANYGHPRVSRDGTRLAVEVQDAQGRTDIWLYDLGGQAEARQFTQGGNNSRPIWTPDGEYITFTSTRDGTPSVWWQKSDFTGEAMQLTKSDGAEHWPDAWSPDGRTLAFTRWADRQDQSVWILTPGEGNDPVMFTENLAGGAAFSPTGNWIAYRGTPNPETPLQVQLFLRPFPENGQRQQVSLDGGSFPVFSPDGRRLFYRRASPAAGGPSVNELVEIDISFDGRVTYGTEVVLPYADLPARSGIRDYDVVPGDDRLLLVVPAVEQEADAASGLDFRMVFNWFEDLEARMPDP